MKPKSWRTYYGFRPNYAYLGVIPESTIRHQEKAYVAWLAEARDTSQKAAEQHARSQHSELVASNIDRDSKARAEDHVTVLVGGDAVTRSAIIRTVRCHHTRYHYQPKAPYSGPDKADTAWEWHKLDKPDAPTTYAVIIDGRCVNSFLTKARAKQWATERLKVSA